MKRAQTGLLALLLLVARGATAGGIADTVHNLSASGPGEIKAQDESQICVFCHTPHVGKPQGPLWNHELSAGVTYVKYSSATMRSYTDAASAPDPNGSSKLCLSCHDGTVALGAVGGGREIRMKNGKGRLRRGDKGFIGTDLRRTHPVSIAPGERAAAPGPDRESALDLVAMKSDRDVHLDPEGRVQCTSCHDPHRDDNFHSSGVRFYRKPDASGPCTVCHAVPTAAAPAPVTFARSLSGAATAHGDPTTLPRGCLSCHAGHTGEEGATGLLRARDENACYRCHGSGRGREVSEKRLAESARAVDIQSEFLKPSHHPVEWPGDHKPGRRLPESDPNARRSVKCVDCHDSHATLRKEAEAPAGARHKRSPTRRFTHEYELCLVCHGPAANRPASQPDMSRQFAGTSFHPVLSPGRAAFVPSLLPPLTAASMLDCTDCHRSDNPRGPAGPHGSIYPKLLGRAYARDDNQPESQARYDLCYSCHSRTSILADQSFPHHRRHVVDQRAPCAACHNAHGSDQPHLIAFDPMIVRPNRMGQIAFMDQGSEAQCYLNCHGAEHNPRSYCGPGMPCPGSPQQLQPSREAVPVIQKPESLFPGWPTF